MIRIGMIGLGKMGLSHYGLINPHPQVEVTAICDSSSYVAEVLSARTGAKVFSDYRKMIDQCDLDAVIISTPTATHLPMGRAALDSGLHVFLEKPMTLSADDSLALAEAADSAGLVNQVGYVNRFNAVFGRARQLLADGALGRLHHFTASMRGNVVTKPMKGSWRSKKDQGGGCLFEYGSHCIDLVHFMLGRPDRVAGSRMERIFSAELEDAVYTTFLYDDGPSGHVSVNWCDPTYRKAANAMEFCGDNGLLQVGKQDCRVYLRKAACGLPEGWSVEYQTDLVKSTYFFLRGEDYSDQLDHFVRCIQDRTLANTCSFAAGAETDAVMAEIRRDAGEGH